MVTKEPDYTQKPDFGTLVDKHRQLPFKRFMDIISAKVASLNDILNQPAAADQYPGKIVPGAVPYLFGPLPLTTPRRSGDGSFEGFATLANPAAYVTARNGNLMSNRETTFEAQSVSAYGFLTWGYTSNPGFSVPRLGAVGDIFDDVRLNNGGAMPMDYFGGFFGFDDQEDPVVGNYPNISFDIDLYDRLRGRRLHEQKIPVELFSGGRFGHRKLASPIRFEQGSNVEPRLYINEIRMGTELDPPTPYNAASVKAYVCLVFKGRQFLEVPGV